MEKNVKTKIIENRKLPTGHPERAFVLPITEDRYVSI